MIWRTSVQKLLLLMMTFLSRFEDGKMKKNTDGKKKKEEGKLKQKVRRSTNINTLLRWSLSSPRSCVDDDKRKQKGKKKYNKPNVWLPILC